MSIRSVLILVGAWSVVALACGGATPEPEAPDYPEPDLTPTPAPEGPPQPYAKILEITAGQDNPKDRRLHIEFKNPTDNTCRFKSYVLKWPGGSKQMPLEDAKIPPGNSRLRQLIVHPNDGAIESLSIESASIELDMDCN